MKSKDQEQLQRTPEWFQERRGRFTASNITNLLGKITLKRTVDAIHNYALEAAIDTVYNVEPEPEYLPADMQRGVELEPLAFELFVELMAVKFIAVKEVGFVKYGAHSGASADGLVGKDGVLEIKCPKRKKFFELVASGVDAVEQKYIDQMQHQMLCNDRKKAYFFNYVIDQGIVYHHTIIIPRDNERTALIDERINIASKEKSVLIKAIKANKQF